MDFKLEVIRSIHTLSDMIRLPAKGVSDQKQLLSFTGGKVIQKKISS